VGDLVVVDLNTAIKLAYGAKMGISPKVHGPAEGNAIQRFVFDNFSVVINPAVKTAWINNSMNLDELDKTIEMYESFLEAEEVNEKMSAYTDFVKKFIKAHPDMPVAEAMKKAAVEWKKKGAKKMAEEEPKEEPQEEEVQEEMEEEVEEKEEPKEESHEMEDITIMLEHLMNEVQELQKKKKEDEEKEEKEAKEEEKKMEDEDDEEEELQKKEEYPEPKDDKKDKKKKYKYPEEEKKMEEEEEPKEEVVENEEEEKEDEPSEEVKEMSQEIKKLKEDLNKVTAQLNEPDKVSVKQELSDRDIDAEMLEFLRTV